MCVPDATSDSNLTVSKDANVHNVSLLSESNLKLSVGSSLTVAWSRPACERSKSRVKTSGTAESGHTSRVPAFSKLTSKSIFPPTCKSVTSAVAGCGEPSVLRVTTSGRIAGNRFTHRAKAPRSNGASAQLRTVNV